MKKQRNSTGRTLTKLREAEGWTQADLADVSQVSQATISKIEAGLREPSFATAKRLARAFRVTLDQFANSAKTT